MNLSRNSKLFLKKNNATILTVIGAVGVVATAVSAAKAATKASKILEEAKAEKGEELTKSEKFKIAAPSYIPAVLFGATTITCIFGANILNKRTQASLAGAYSLLDQSYKNYKDKVAELYGEDANDKIVEEIAKDAYIPYEPQKELFYDVFSKRYFENTMENVLAAETEINKLMVTGYGVGLNEFYALIGLDSVSEFDELGWSSCTMYDMYWHAWIEFDHKKILMDDGVECILLEMPLAPFVDYLD